MKDDRVYLSHIRDAVIRNLEIIGEAARHLSEDLRARHPEIPWMRIAGLRDVLIHEYFGVRMDRVWRVVEHRLTELKRLVESMLSE